MQKNDKVWFDLSRRLAGIAGEVKTSRPSHNILVLAHFPATLSAIEACLRATGVSFQTFTLFDPSSLCSGITGNVMTGLARMLQPPSGIQQPARGALRVIVGEHHPRAANDQHVIDVVNSLPCAPEVQFHISLDDPLLMLFGGEKLIALMKTLGMDESECIEHRFVTNAIRNAQENLETKVPRELTTESIADWFKYNLRQER